MAEFITKIRTDEGDKQIDYNALANLPTTDTTLSVSGKAADAQAVGEALDTMATKEQVSSLSNPNLLINSDFRNPINQRSQSQYSSAPEWTYSIDRWKFIGDLTVKLESGYLALTNNENTSWFMQEFEYEMPKGNYIVTAKVLNVTGTCNMYFENSSGASTKKTINNTGLVTLSVNQSINAITFELQGVNSKLQLEWVKVEAGTISTLFIPRIYGEEVALCRRFYQVETLNNPDIACYLHKRNNASYGGVKHFEPMRVIPTVTRSGEFYIEQYDSSGQIYATMENEFDIEITPQWSELKFMINLNTVNPVNSLAAASVSVVFRFDAEIY